MEILGEIPVIESERLIVRRPTLEDTAAVKSLAAETEVYRYLPGFLFELIYDEPVGASKYIESYEVEVLGVYTKGPSEQFIGLVEIYDYNREEGYASIGYRLKRDAWGRGFATEMVGAVLAYLNTRADVRLVHAEVMLGNEASMRVLEKCGFLSAYVAETADWGRGDPVQIYNFTRRF